MNISAYQQIMMSPMRPEQLPAAIGIDGAFLQYYQPVKVASQHEIQEGDLVYLKPKGQIPLFA